MYVFHISSHLITYTIRKELNPQNYNLLQKTN